MIIENLDSYVRTIEDVRFLPKALDGLRRFSESKFLILIITNQSAVGRGLLSESELLRINRHIIDQIEIAGGRVEKVYVCPHHPSEQCLCRKPAPGLILQAKVDFNLDLSGSILVGDAVSDAYAGMAAGVGRIAMVRTGRGQHQIRQLDQNMRSKITVFEDLYSASLAVSSNGSGWS